MVSQRVVGEQPSDPTSRSEAPVRSEEPPGRAVLPAVRSVFGFRCPAISLQSWPKVNIICTNNKQLESGGGSTSRSGDLSGGRSQSPPRAPVITVSDMVPVLATYDIISTLF